MPGASNSRSSWTVSSSGARSVMAARSTHAEGDAGLPRTLGAREQRNEAPAVPIHPDAKQNQHARPCGYAEPLASGAR
jgi:hypothetical protein